MRSAPAILVMLCSLIGVALRSEPADFQPPAGENSVLTGQKLAQQACVGCHLYPDPQLLDKRTWKQGALPWMKIHLGLDPDAIANSPESSLLAATGIFPAEPVLSSGDFEKISAFYLANAPEAPLPRERPLDITVGLESFKAKPQRFKRSSDPVTTMVHIDEERRRLLVGDALNKTLEEFDSDGRLLVTYHVANIPAALTPASEGWWLTSIGRFYPSEDPHGDIRFVQRHSRKLVLEAPILTRLQRPTHLTVADMDHDGAHELIVSMFGNFAGRLSLFSKEDGKWEDEVLWNLPGVLRTEVADFNRDGRLDIIALVAQRTEALIAFLQQPDGSFTPRTLFQRHPLFGHTWFQLIDFDKDGDLDVLTTNGDNGEYDSPTKNYHGIRLYLNNGEDLLEEALFIPLHGAFKALAHDFDQDGDFDIAAISFFPDYEKAPKEGFVLLTQRGPLDFAASTFRSVVSGRWLTMDAGDLDGDGDVDIALGSAIRGPGTPPKFLVEAWEQSGMPFIILENLTR